MAPSYCKDKALRKKIQKAQKKRINAVTINGLLGSDVEAGCAFDILQESISEGTMKALKEMGYQTMTEIQAKSIPRLLEGVDLRGTAKTGSGKTLAFLIPVIELLVKLRFKTRNGTGAIIISPTRELSMQTYGVLRELMKYHNQTFHMVIGGTDMKNEAEKLAKGINILVATPGRLLSHLENTPHFNYRNLACLVIDEADRIFEFGFYEAMKKIVQLIPEHRQTMLFSATKDHRTNALVQLYIKTNPLEVDIQSTNEQATNEGLEQAYLVCPTDKRFLVLYTFIRKNFKKKMMIFFSASTTVKFYHDLLNFISVPVMCIYGNQSPSHRISTFHKFCNATSGILLCTSIAARGWDVPSVNWIIQYDPPEDPKEYIHRVGRTARAGGTGRALLFLTESEVGFISYLKAHKVIVEPMDIAWSKLHDVQKELEQVVNPNYHLRSVARDGFIGFVRAYESHSLKKFFDINKLDLHQVAKSFCLNKTPKMTFNNSNATPSVQVDPASHYDSRTDINNYKSFKRRKYD